MKTSIQQSKKSIFPSFPPSFFIQILTDSLETVYLQHPKKRRKKRTN
ncbi:hypothetical protein B4135_0172 [Caldibacillus debilis]|uniref:Uncharacterized protein n=1 Tax=Caldibacillus debilis TaxID=301148 RepID=A0A150LVY9_9BACI|nr:hypothetical protein B4135_0172 [Caldibacillus debilis]